MNCCLSSFKILYEGLPAILCREFAPTKSISLTPGHFCPLSSWDDSGFGRMTDGITGDVYKREEFGEKRLKCLKLALITPLVQPLGLSLNVINRISKVIFILYSCTFEDRSLVGKIKKISSEATYIALAPIIFLGMELAAVYGICYPFDGGKLYASFELLAYSRAFLAPCFQPDY